MQTSKRSNLRNLLIEANKTARKLVQLNKQIGDAIVSALKNEIDDVVSVVDISAPNEIALISPMYSGYWNVRAYLERELVPLHALLWQLECEVFNETPQFVFITTPDGIFLPRDKAERVARALRDLLERAEDTENGDCAEPCCADSANGDNI